MASHKVDALSGRPIVFLIQIWAPCDTLSKLRGGVLVALDKAADVVAKLPIPFLPLILTKAANLIKTTRIPCFRNEFCSGKDRIGVDLPNDRWVQHGLTRFVARKYRR